MHWQHKCYYGLGMDALLSVCTGNTNVIMVWAWMLWLSDVLRTRTLLWSGHGCSGYRMHSEHEHCHGLGMDALLSLCTGNTNVIMVWVCMLRLSDALRARTFLWFGHGCSGYRMHSEHERYYGLGMDVLVVGCIRNRNVIMVWAWALWLSDAPGTRTLWFGHGCSGYRMFSEHERYYGLDMNALVIACTRNKNIIMVWPWMLRLSYALEHRKARCAVYAPLFLALETLFEFVRRATQAT